MLHFNYTLDNELKARVGELPSGIQTQAFQMALYRMVPRFEQLKQMLMQRTPTGAMVLEGLNEQWQERLKAESAFVGQLPSRMLKVAKRIAEGDIGDALMQSKLSGNWNTWAPRILSLYGKVLDAFEKDVNKAVSNEPSMTVDESFRMISAALFLPAAPSFPAVEARGLGDMDIDPDYLAGVKVFGKELNNGQLAGMGLAALGGYLVWRGWRMRQRDLGYYW